LIESEPGLSFFLRVSWSLFQFPDRSFNSISTTKDIHGRIKMRIERQFPIIISIVCKNYLRMQTRQTRQTQTLSTELITSVLQAVLLHST
jgi:hypothetical protein